MGRIFGNGINQADLVDLLVLLRTNMIGIQAKLDLDGGVADTDYAAGTLTLLAAVPSGIQITGPKCIRSQGDVAFMLNDLICKWNATLSKLDLDGTVNATNYNSLWAVTDVVGNSKIDSIFDAGMEQSSLVKVLDQLIASIAGVTAKLDLDSGVSGTNFAALWAVTDTVVESGTYSRVRKLLAILAIGATLFGFPTKAHARYHIEGSIINSSVTYNVNPDVDLQRIQSFAVQAVSSTGTAIAAQNFTDGVRSSAKLTVAGTGNANRAATISINGVTLTAGVDWSTAATTTLIAQSISSAIVNNASLRLIVTSTFVANVIFTTSTFTGINPYIVTSSTAGLTWNIPYYGGGVAPSFLYTTDTFSTTTAYGFPLGLQVLYTTVTALTPIGGLLTGTTYYVIPVTPLTYKLASSALNAVGGTAVDISSASMAVGGDSFKLTPLSYSSSTSNAGLKWQVSNDRSNWTDLSTVSFSSVTFVAASTPGTSIWDFQFLNYRYLRAVLVAPTSGWINWMINIFGRGDE